MEQLISQELGYGGNLDFDNLDGSNDGSNTGYTMQTLDSR